MDYRQQYFSKENLGDSGRYSGMSAYAQGHISGRGEYGNSFENAKASGAGIPTLALLR